jgi:glycosyltransferase involved in cell wall biosynthesis
LRILLSSELFFPDVYGGGERFAFEVSRALVEKGNEVHVLAPRTSTAYPRRRLPACEVVEGITVHRLKGKFQYGSALSTVPYLTRLERAARDVIRDEKIEVVNAHAFRPCLPLFMASQRRAPCVATFHDVYSRGSVFGAENWLRIYGLWGVPGWGLEQLILRLPYSRVTTVSMTVRDKLSRFYDSSKIDVVYCGVDLSKFPNRRPEKVQGRILYLGRLIQYKNVWDLIRAVDLVHSQNEQAHLVIAGSGPLSSEIAGLSKRRSYISYLGRVDENEKVKLLSEAQVLALPSSDEGLGICLMEANAAFTPYVAYDIPAVREATGITHGGLLAQHRNVADLASRIGYLLANPEKAYRYAEDARATLARDFSWTTVAERLEQSFLKALARSDRHH